MDKESKKLKDFIRGKRILITAGPTREKIDDVRYISNHSSGKMGYALADAANRLGGIVTLVSGPVHLTVDDDIEIINTESAQEMYNAVISKFVSTDIAIMTAAVADYTPSEKYSGKLKKDQVGNEMILHLTKTKDILAETSKNKTEVQLVIGFALESNDEIKYGKDKLKKKQCNMIVINSSSKPDSGFGGDKNTITVISDKGMEKKYPAMLKTECALEILKAISEY